MFNLALSLEAITSTLSPLVVSLRFVCIAQSSRVPFDLIAGCSVRELVFSYSRVYIGTHTSNFTVRKIHRGPLSPFASLSLTPEYMLT